MPLARDLGLISDQEQYRLAESTVLIAGVGGVGGQVAETLARVGIGHLIVTDPDGSAVSNLNWHRVPVLEAITGGGRRPLPPLSTWETLPRSVQPGPDLSGKESIQRGRPRAGVALLIRRFSEPGVATF